MKSTLKLWPRLAAKFRRAAQRIATPRPPARAAPDVILNNQLLRDKNVLITGAGRNIGRSIALEMANQGANVYFTDIDASRVQAVSDELRGCAGVSHGFLSDVSENADVAELCEELQKRALTIDVLVNNVGVNIGTAPFTSLPLDWVRRCFDANVFGPLDLTQRIARQMIAGQKHGSIIFVTSVHQWTVRGMLAYSAAKAALGMIVSELAVELAPHGIRVNGIAPGFVKEDENGQAVSHRPAILHGSSIKPCYIGRAAVYLAADYFSWFTTGTVLKIDGGLSLGNHTVYCPLPH